VTRQAQVGAARAELLPQSDGSAVLRLSCPRLLISSRRDGVQLFVNSPEHLPSLLEALARVLSSNPTEGTSHAARR
jgi:hypothetical protein